MPKLYTIGHSNHDWETFLDMLKANRITHLVDVRSIPKSRFVPWTNQKVLASKLKRENITYIHMPHLGGLRKAKKDSQNLGWRNSSFRGFADYMLTDKFFQALKELNTFIKKNKVAIMCAESLPWRCHRSLISDAECARNIKVFHIMNSKTLREHVMTHFAVIDKKHSPIKIFYPKDDD